MKKLTSFLNLMAVSVALFAGVSPANAVPALKGFSPNDATMVNPGGATVAIKGLPAWFQGQDGVAVKPCLDVARCVLVGAPDFNGALPLSYPTNFPSEAFYFNATNANITVGTANALVVMALEFTFVDALGNLVPASTPGAVGNPFQRLRLVHTFVGGGGNLALLGIPAAGSFRVATPWGTAVFPVSTAKCVNQGGDTKCSMTRDQPVAGPNPTAALGDPVLAPGSISTFLKDAAGPPPGFLGLGAAVLAFTGGAPNSITVTDPLGNVGTTTQLTTLTGMTVGMEITPPATGNDFAVVKAFPGSVRKTYTINNLTGAVIGQVPVTIPPTPPAPVTFTANITNTATLSTDFTVAAPLAIVAPATKACGALGGGAATIAIGEICSFDVIFAPKTADGPKSATISIAGANAPTAQVTVTGIADGTTPALTLTSISRFSKLTGQTISGTVSDANGIAGVNVAVDGALATAATVNAAAGTWSFNVAGLAPQTVVAGVPTPAHTIVITATDNAQSTAVASPGGNLATVNDSITVDTTAPAVTVPDPATPTKTIPLFTNNNSPVLSFTSTDVNLSATTLKVDGALVSAAAASPATLATLTDGPHSVTIDALDAAGNITSVTNNFTVDTIAPVINIAAPVITAAGTIGVTSPVLDFPITDNNIDPTKTTVTLDSVPLAIPASGKVPLGPFVVGAPHTLTINATDLAGNVAPTKTVNFSLLLTDGSMTTLGATAPTIADVILALKVAIGGFPETASITPTTDAFKHGDVAPLDAVTGKPVPDGKIDVGDVLTILKKVVGLTTTF